MRREKMAVLLNEDETVLAHGPVRRILSTRYCNFHEFTKLWPQLAASGLYPEFGRTVCFL